MALRIISTSIFFLLLSLLVFETPSSQENSSLKVALATSAGDAQTDLALESNIPDFSLLSLSQIQFGPSKISFKTKSASKEVTIGKSLVFASNPLYLAFPPPLNS